MLEIIPFRRTTTTPTGAAFTARLRFGAVLPAFDLASRTFFVTLRME